MLQDSGRGVGPCRLSVDRLSMNSGVQGDSYVSGRIATWKSSGSFRPMAAC